MVSSYQKGKVTFRKGCYDLVIAIHILSSDFDKNLRTDKSSCDKTIIFRLSEPRNYTLDLGLVSPRAWVY